MSVHIQILYNTSITHGLLTRSNSERPESRTSSTLGARTTSPLESLHKEVKTWIHTLTQDLDIVINAINLTLTEQYHHIRADIAHDESRLPFNLSPKIIKILPSNIHHFVSKTALKHIKQQYLLVITRPPPKQEAPPSLCSIAFEQIYGLPCCHYIRDALSANEIWTISERDVNPH